MAEHEGREGRDGDVDSAWCGNWFLDIHSLLDHVADHHLPAVEAA
jgi:hypothetical protein